MTNGSSGEAPGRRPDTSRMRSSIACARCRRSKTKCENNGIGTVCKSCANSKRDCSYETSTAPGSGSAQRRESSAAGPNGVSEVDGPPRKRKKILAPTSGIAPGLKDGSVMHDDPLNSPLLTAQVWKDLFKIYERHFSTDFPFLHKTRFLRPLEQVSTTASPSIPRPPHDPPLLLAFLTQTARFHKGLVAQIGSPVATAEYYAEATRKAMGDDFPGKPSLERTQALLMLGFHEWTELQGQKGWVKIRTAISCAQALGYQYDANLDDRKNETAKEEDIDYLESEQFIDREIQRRTFWSCFIMDRYVSCGSSRPQMLAVKKLRRIQLPCSDSAFNHGRKVRTRLLGEDDEMYERRRARVRDSSIRLRDGGNDPQRHRRATRPEDEIEWEFGKYEGELSLYIQAVDLFGEVNEWSCAGGRRTEVVAPWNDESQFKRLESDLYRLKTALPRHFQMTPRNTENHIYTETSKNYVLIHALYTHCTIALYREYMAFLPWDVTAPQGPLDEPIITEQVPHDVYWPSQARACFGAAKDFADLLNTCQSHQSLGVLLETPIAGFATYGVSWCALYCHYFPRMDPAHALDSRIEPNAWDISTKFIRTMCDRWKMATQWIDFLRSLQQFFRQKRIEWKRAGGSPGSIFSDNGAGLKEYSEDFESAQKEFGSLADINWTSNATNKNQIKSLHDRDSEDRTEAASPAMTYKSEKEEPSEDRSVSTPAPSASFTPVNGNPKPATTTPIADTPTSVNYAPQVYGPQAFNQDPTPNPSTHYSTTYTPTTSYGYHHGTVQSNESALRAGQDLHHLQKATPGPVAGRTIPQSQWPYPLNPEQIRMLTEEGAIGISAIDYYYIITADGPIGGQYTVPIEPMLNSWPNLILQDQTLHDEDTQDHVPQGRLQQGHFPQGHFPQGHFQQGQLAHGHLAQYN